MLFKKKQAADERIEKRTNELCVKMFPAIWFVNAIFLIVKIAYRLPVMVYSLEILILVSGIAVWLIEEMRYGTLFAKEKDEVLKELSIKAKNESLFYYVLGGSHRGIHLCHFC